MSIKRIKRISPLQTGKVTAIVSVALILIIFIPFLLLGSLVGAGSQFGGMFFGGGILMIIFIPILYGIFGFIFGLLYAAVYNFTYKYHGGMELEYDDLDIDVNSIGQ